MYKQLCIIKSKKKGLTVVSINVKILKKLTAKKIELYFE